MGVRPTMASALSPASNTVFLRVSIATTLLIEHHALALLRDDDGSSTKVDADIILCHNCLNPFSAFLYHVCNARSGGQKTKTALV